MDLKILYNDKQYSLQDLIKEGDGFVNQLRLLEFIKVDAMSVILATNHVAPFKNMVIMQKLGALQNMVSFARFNLIFAHKKLHKSPFDWKSGYEAQMFLRSNYLQNAILNYNNIRDIFLQIFWFSSKADDYKLENKEQYETDLKPKWDEITKTCSKNDVLLSAEFCRLICNNLVKENKELANTIKHHGNIVVKGFENDFFSIPLSFAGEEASYLEQVIDIDMYCLKLLDLHNFYVDLSENVWRKLNFESHFQWTDDGYSVTL